MAEYNLMPNEAILIKADNVTRGSARINTTYELLLTNLNIVLISKNMLGTVKSIQSFPINQIKVFNNQAQVMLGKSNSVYPQLEVYFSNSVEKFGLTSKREVSKWIKTLNQLVFGEEVNIDNSASSSIFENEIVAGATEILTDSLKDTIGIFKDVVGLKSQKETKVKRITKKCAYCGAPIAGVIGQTVRCSYCDSEQHI